MMSTTHPTRLRTLRLVSVLAAAALLGGCTIHTRSRGTVHASGSVRVTTPTYVTVSDAPPPLKPAVRTRPAHRANAAVWIEGHWTWNGGWVWVDGRWDTPPEPGYVWEPPVVVAVADGGYQFHRGYWRPRDRQPPAVYRTDGTIRVHVRTADEPVRANRVVVRAGEPPPRTVVVGGGAREGSSSSVTVRTTGSATVRTRSADDRGDATVRTRPADDRGDATVRTRPADGDDRGVRVRAGDDREARGNSANANTRVRPASEARGNDQSANTRVRPASEARGNDQNANTRVRPASEARGNDQNANTRVRTPSGMQQAGPRSCRLQVAVLPRNGVLVIRGSGLDAATGVMIGSQRVPLLDKRDDRVRARVQGRNHGGSVKVLFGDERESCGTLRITGR